MSRQVIGYERGRPIFKDEGPGRGRVGLGGSDVISRLGAQVLPQRFLTGGNASFGEQGGAGDVERRQATDAQRVAWAAEAAGRPAARRPFRQTAEEMQAHRLRGGETNRKARRLAPNHPFRMPINADRPPAPPRDPSPPEEVPVLPISRTTDVHPIPPGTLPSHTAGALQTQVVPLTPPTTGTGGVLALERAEVEALEEAQAIAATDGAHVITDSIPGDRPGIVAPCGDCAHAVVCSIKPALEADVALDLAAVGLPSGIRLSLISVDCDHFLRALPPLASRIAEAYAPPQDAREGVTAPEADDDVADDAPAAEPPAAPRWDAKESRSTAELEARDRRAAQVLAALERHGSDPEAVRKVAHEFGLRPNAVALIAKAARARQAVPA